MLDRLARFLPILQWGRHYHRQALAGDLMAAVIVTVLLIPQSLAYALLAGLPAEMGLYASILPLVGYALFGTSRTLSVGPVAVVSLLTAAAVGRIAEPGSVGYLSAAVLLALMSGLLLLLMGLMRLGFLANFLSHPVVAGFITASGIIIAVGQVGNLLGVAAHGDNLRELLTTLLAHIDAINWPTALVGVPALLVLFWVRSSLRPLLERLGVAPALAVHLARTGPVLLIIVTTLAAWLGGLDALGVALVGEVPSGLPVLALPVFDASLWGELAGAAVMISIIGYVESVSVGKTLAAKRRERIDPDQEMIGLGVANVAAAVSGGFPVTGGFSRSVVNFDAGATTQAASLFTAAGIGLAALLLTPLLAYLPKATLAATIIVAVLSLVDFSMLRRTWSYSKSDFIAVALTILVTLSLGVELGVLCGVLASLALHLYKTSRPHMAIVGEVPGTEHFRNVERHQVVTYPHIISLRVDESLYFANAAYLEDTVYRLIAERPEVEQVVLMCNAINEIDQSALETLEAINERLGELGMRFHLSEVKGPVMDRLRRTDFLEQLTGKVYLSQHQAIEDLR